MMCDENPDIRQQEIAETFREHMTERARTGQEFSLDYAKYRGRCREHCESAIELDPTLRLVRGYYYCLAWGKQQHFWTVRPDGSIYDPTRFQFPCKGEGIYEEFDGSLNCSQCGKSIKEEDAIPMGNYGVCSEACALRLVGL